MTKLAENNPQGTANIADDRVLAVVFCDYGVARGYSYNRLTDTSMRPYIDNCRCKARYNITTMNKKGSLHKMNVCERHKKKIESRFTIVECVIFNNR